MEKNPSKCNICGGEVSYCSNARVYGKEYGSGKMYYCEKCGAYVGTSKTRPRDAVGILANAEMRDIRKKCHDLIEKKWKTGENEREKYALLAQELDIPLSECQLGCLVLTTLRKAYEILKRR